MSHYYSTNREERAQEAAERGTRPPLNEFSAYVAVRENRSQVRSAGKGRQESRVLLNSLTERHLNFSVPD